VQEWPLRANLPYLAAIAIGVIAATAGRYIVDLTCGVTPKQFVKGEWFMGTAILASVVYVVCAAGLDFSVWPATLVSFTVAFLFRYAALLRHWEEPGALDAAAARGGRGRAATDPGPTPEGVPLGRPLTVAQYGASGSCDPGVNGHVPTPERKRACLEPAGIES
jgi:hypothetical protein